MGTETLLDEERIAELHEVLAFLKDIPADKMRCQCARCVACRGFYRDGEALLSAASEVGRLRSALAAANAIIGEQADEARRLQDTIDRQQKTLRSLAEHEPSWSDDFLRARAALIGVEATLAGEKVER